MSQLKRYNGSSWEAVGGNPAPKTAKTTSDTDTYSCNYINTMNEYSTNEIDTGKKWIDGKSIYRKVVPVNSPSSAATWITVYSGAISNYDNVIKISGFFKTTANEFLPVPYGEGSYYMDFRITSGGNLQCTRNGFGSISFMYVILEYTKTS